jgi:hypothetical protein
MWVSTAKGSDPKGFCEQPYRQRLRVAGKALSHEMGSETLRVSVENL